MALILTQKGALLLWEYLLGFTPAQYPVCHLLGESFPISPLSTEADFEGSEIPRTQYTPITLAAPPLNWGFTDVPLGQMATHSTLIFPVTGASQVCGYWLSDLTSSIAIWGELFPTPFPFGGSGGTFYLDLSPSMISLPPT